jgi:hypothetical protein
LGRTRAAAQPTTKDRLAAKECGFGQVQGALVLEMLRGIPRGQICAWKPLTAARR